MFWLPRSWFGNCTKFSQTHYRDAVWWCIENNKQKTSGRTIQYAFFRLSLLKKKTICNRENENRMHLAWFCYTMLCKYWKVSCTFEMEPNEKSRRGICIKKLELETPSSYHSSREEGVFVPGPSDRAFTNRNHLLARSSMINSSEVCLKCKLDLKLLLIYHQNEMKRDWLYIFRLIKGAPTTSASPVLLGQWFEHV